jgi:hypothetical protein
MTLDEIKAYIAVYKIHMTEIELYSRVPHDVEACASSAQLFYTIVEERLPDTDWESCSQVVWEQ